MNIIPPKDYKENLIYRSKMLAKMKANNEFSYMIKAYCKRDILFWLNTFAWLHEPNVRKPRRGKIPFITYKFQDKAILDMVHHIDKGLNIALEKSRDMGATWMVLLIFQWYWMFGGSANDFLIGSITAAKTDKLGILDTLFEKLRFNLYYQPEVFIPRGFVKQYHDGFMKLVNPETKSYISGDTNKFFATSGRYKAIFFDEFAKWARGEDRLAWQSASDATPCKIAVSSANGKNNLFYELRSGKAGKIKLLRLHWRDHPLKNTRWYNAEKRRRSKADLAAEVDIDYLASIGNRAAENWNYEVHTLRQVLYDKNLPLELNCDFNINPMFFVLSQTIKKHRYTFREFVEETTITDFVIRKILRSYKNHNQKVMYLYGDASGRYGGTRSRLSDWDIIKQACRSEGWTIVDRVPIKNPSHVDRMNIINKRLKDYENDGMSWETIDRECKQLIESIESTERNDNNILKTDGEHGFDAWTYGPTYEYPILERKVYQIKRAI